jgi:hypothetical protein
VFEFIVRVVLSLLESAMSLFGTAHHLERRLTDASRVGRSKMDEEAHTWRSGLLGSWFVGWLLVLIFFGGAGYLLWEHFFG